MAKLFPIILIFLDLGASIVYFISGDWKLGLYWLFAGGLTLMVTI